MSILGHMSFLRGHIHTQIATRNVSGWVIDFILQKSCVFSYKL